MARAVAADGPGPRRADPAGRAGRSVPGWLIGVLVGAALVLAPSFVVVVAVLLMPGLLAHVAGGADGRAASRTMLLFGCCGCVSPVREMWQQLMRGGVAGAHAMPTIGAQLGAPDLLATAWLAAGAGWLVVELAPVVTRTVAEAAEARRIAQLLAMRAQLEAEWETAPPD
jgi:hypothetical protein